MSIRGLFGVILVTGVIGYACGWAHGFDEGYEKARKRYLEAMINLKI